MTLALLLEFSRAIFSFQALNLVQTVNVNPWLATQLLQDATVDFEIARLMVAAYR